MKFMTADCTADIELILQISTTELMNKFHRTQIEIMIVMVIFFSEFSENQKINLAETTLK